jgi:arginine transport system substrate-binding protein
MCLPIMLNGDDELIVGLESGYPPFEFVDTHGEVIGFDVDIARLIASKLGKKLVIKDMDFDSEILSLQQGKIDLIISGMNITPSRKKVIHMVPYHGADATSLSLIFWSEIPSTVKTLQDIAALPNPVVSVQVGSVADEYLSLFPQIQKRVLQGALAPFLDVKYGKSAATLVETEVAVYLHDQHPTTHVLEIPLEGSQVNGFGIGIKKTNTSLIDEIEAVVHNLHTTSDLQNLEGKWFGGEK